MIYVASGFDLDESIVFAIEIVREKSREDEIGWDSVHDYLTTLQENYLDKKLLHPPSGVTQEGTRILAAVALVRDAALCEGAKVVDQQFQKEGLLLGLEAAEKLKSYCIEQGYDPLVGFSFSIIGNAYYELKEYCMASESYLACLKIRETLKDEHSGLFVDDVAMVLNNLGNVQSKLHDFSSAILSFRDALTVYRKLAEDDPDKYLVALASTLGNLGVVKSEISEFHEAIDLLAESADITRQLIERGMFGDSSQLLTVLTNLASSQDEVCEFDSAKATHEEAMRLCKELLEKDIDFRSIVSTTFHNAGCFYHEVGDLVRAKELCEKSIALRKELAVENPRGHDLDLAVSLNLLGSISFDVNLIEVAHQNYFESVNIFARSNKELDGVFELNEANALNGFGVCQYEMGFFNDALESYQKALVLLSNVSNISGDTYKSDVAMIHGNIANTLSELNRNDEALDSYSDALKIRKELADKNPLVFLPELASCFNSLGTFYRERGDYKKSYHYHRQSLEIRKKLFESNPKVYGHELASVLNSIGVLAREVEDWHGAERNFREAIELYEVNSNALSTANLESRQIAYNNLGMVLLKRGEIDDSAFDEMACSAFRESLHHLERYRGALIDPFQRRRVYRDNQAVYCNLIDACFRVWSESKDTNLICEIIDTSEASRMRFIRDLLDGHPMLPLGVPTKLAKSFEKLHEEIINSRRELSFSIVSQGRVFGSITKNNRIVSRFRFGVSSEEGELKETSVVNEISTEIARLVSKRELLVRQIRIYDASFDPDLPVRETNSGEILQLLSENPDATLVHYSFTVNGAYAVILAHDHREVIQLGNFTSSELRMLARQWIEFYRETASGLLDAEDDQSPWPLELEEALADVLGRVAKNVVLPILDFLPATKKLVICSPHSLQVFPLHACLLPSGEFLGDRFSISYTPSLSVFKSRFEPEIGENLKVLFVGDPAGDLPLARLEVEQLSRYYNNSVKLVKEQATKREFLSIASEMACVHYAGHSKFDFGDNLETALMLSDSRMTLRNIFSEFRMSGGGLVILNGCETGNVVPDAFDDYLSFPVGFIYAGASAVISSLWIVDDLVAFLVMKQFHSNYSTGQTAGEALDGAVAWLRDDIKTGRQLYQEIVPNIIQQEDCGPFVEDCMAHAKSFAEKFPNDPPFASPLYWGSYILAGNADQRMR